MTTIDDDIREMRNAVHALKWLLDEPEPGLVSWREAVGVQIKRLEYIRRGDVAPSEGDDDG